MNELIAPALAGALSLFVFGNATQAADRPSRHSLESDYGFMIGRWTCHVTEAGTAGQDIDVEYEWAYDKHILRESMRHGSTLIGEFLTSYDKATDRFKGVGVGDWGYVVWENAGFYESRLSEKGFTLDSGKMTPVSRSEFERASATPTMLCTTLTMAARRPIPRTATRLSDEQSICPALLSLYFGGTRSDRGCNSTPGGGNVHL